MDYHAADASPNRHAFINGVIQGSTAQVYAGQCCTEIWSFSDACKFVLVIVVVC